MEAVAEQKNLKMHKKLLLDVIRKQAGSIDKAVLEGVMNSIEANATEVFVDFIIVDGKAVLSIKDDGMGISTEKELIEHFETFGTPHEENENKTWARFRMGRGQIFSFGFNTWKTSTFKMEVDIDNWGLKYHLHKNQTPVVGCEVVVELYSNPIGTYTYPSIDSFKDEIQKQIEFVSTPVYFNGEKLNIAPSALKNWTCEDENAYYLFNVGEGVKVYNLGAYVKRISSWQIGTSGVVISKKRLDVNFARNDVNSGCEVFTAINEIIQKHKAKKVTKKYTALTEYERHSLLKDLRNGTENNYSLYGKRIFKTAQGKWFSLNMIFKNNQKWTFAPTGSRTADMAMQKGQALCLSESVLDTLNYSGKKALFFVWLLKNDKHQWFQKDAEKKILSYIPYDKEDITEGGKDKCLTDGYSSEYVIVAPNKLTTEEKKIISVLSHVCWENRSLCIGIADEASAWTDGNTFIALERNWLKGLNFNSQKDVCQLFTTLCHELAHDDDTEGTHFHGPEFYENYYNITSRRNSPLSYMTSFKNNMDTERMRNRQEKINKKQKKQEEDLKNKLGIAAKV